MPPETLRRIFMGWCARSLAHSVLGSLQTHIHPRCARWHKRSLQLCCFTELCSRCKISAHEYANSDVKNAPESCALWLFWR